MASKLGELSDVLKFPKLIFHQPLPVVLVSLLFASAVSGLSIPSNSALMQARSVHRVPCRPNNDKPEFLPNIEECEYYHICTNGKSFDYSCADGLIFNIDRMQCSPVGRCLLDYEPICQASGDRMPHLYDCRHYYYCEPNVVDPILLACDPGQLFDQRTSQCVPESQAVCGNPPQEDELETWPNNIHFE